MSSNVPSLHNAHFPYMATQADAPVCGLNRLAHVGRQTTLVIGFTYIWNSVQHMSGSCICHHSFILLYCLVCFGPVFSNLFTATNLHSLLSTWVNFIYLYRFSCIAQDRTVNIQQMSSSAVILPWPPPTLLHAMLSLQFVHFITNKRKLPLQNWCTFH